MRPAATDAALPSTKPDAIGASRRADPGDATPSGSEDPAGEPDGERAPSDADLVDAARGGDTQAFDALVRRYMRRAFAVAYRLLGRRPDAEDALQDAFVAALTKLDTFDRQRPFGPWLLRIVANRSINLRKGLAVRRTEPIPAGVASRAASPLEEAERSEVRAELQRALAQLPEQQRWILELFELDGFTGPEIAEMLDLPAGTVRWHLHQARHRLRAVLHRASSGTA
jgi:RNA polymerase sigma-70 factor, ECF subfamily